jgi:hypothetical protein
MRLFVLAMFVACLPVACGGSDDTQGGNHRDTASTPDSQMSDIGFDDTDSPDKDAVVPGDAPAPDGAEADTDHPADTAVQPDLPPGTLTCKQFYQQCVAACPKGGDGQPTAACFDQCRTQLSAEGETVTAALLVCVEDSGCSEISDSSQALSCFSTNCSAEYFGCFSGPDECKDILTCMGACPQGDAYNACVVTCSQDGTEPAQKHLISILQCIGQACCPADAAACGTTEGQACSTAAVQMGGDCFGPVTQCLMGTY